MSSASHHTATTIPTLLAERVRQHPDKAFVVEGDFTLTYGDALKAARALGCWLMNEGCLAGDRVAIWAPNCQQWIVAALGAQLIGATIVTLNTRYKGNEAADILQRSGARFLFCIDHFLNVDYPEQLASHPLPDLAGTVTITLNSQSDAFADCLKQGHALLETSNNNRAALEDAISRVEPDTLSDILFTSGTTGKAKGVVTDHGQNLRAFSAFADILGLEADDRYLIINPFFHSFGYKAGWLATLIAGATAFPLAIFDVPQVMACVARYRINVMPGPPTLFQSILDHPDFDREKLVTLSKATTGAAVIPTQLIEAMWQTLGLDTVITAYGLSESCGLVTMCRRGDAAHTIAHSSGRAIPEVEVAIQSADGDMMAAGESGEIVVRGYNVMRGYFEDSEATEQAIDADGWLHTGDVGHLDDAGNLYITDRLKDMYICGGFNCYPAEIELQIAQHPAVAQAAVVGAPDKRLGEVGVGFLVPAHGEHPDRDELIAWCREHLANYKVPRHIFWVDSLPLNATGKVLKTELRERLGTLIE